MHKKLSTKENDLINNFIDEALLFNLKHNIFIRSNKEEVFEKDIFDCLPLVEKIQPEQKVLDLGSGGGFPGIILAILKPDCEIHLLEKSQKKCYFFEQEQKSRTCLQKTNPRVSAVLAIFLVFGQKGQIFDIFKL